MYACIPGGILLILSRGKKLLPLIAHTKCIVILTPLTKPAVLKWVIHCTLRLCFQSSRCSVWTRITTNILRLNFQILRMSLDVVWLQTTGVLPEALLTGFWQASIDPPDMGVSGGGFYSYVLGQIENKWVDPNSPVRLSSFFFCATQSSTCWVPTELCYHGYSPTYTAMIDVEPPPFGGSKVNFRMNDHGTDLTVDWSQALF